ncbi:hypothetical protein [Metabacillus malikii]|uniref:Uncharacterized protein n=1 Tax=Metabacillus malikii TaxID=1504265 RepID=A0ABT9ZHG6_9BACI|nr:hypothetical protein [Metabacillus malikii]MDQ0230645.1 hypothetical protein [Metabacillus malikii]
MKNAKLNPSITTPSNSNQSLYQTSKRKKVKKRGCGCGKKKKQAE